MNQDVGYHENFSNERKSLFDYYYCCFCCYYGGIEMRRRVKQIEWLISQNFSQGCDQLIGGCVGCELFGREDEKLLDDYSIADQQEDDRSLDVETHLSAKKQCQTQGGVGGRICGKKQQNQSQKKRKQKKRQKKKKKIASNTAREVDYTVQSDPAPVLNSVTGQRQFTDKTFFSFFHRYNILNPIVKVIFQLAFYTSFHFQGTFYEDELFF